MQLNIPEEPGRAILNSEKALHAIKCTINALLCDMEIPKPPTPVREN